MAGEIWRRQAQLGKETVSGTGVAATRIVYLDDIQAKKDKKPTPHKFTTGTRDNVRAVTFGPIIAGGMAKLPVSADELLEWLGMALQGGVTPTTPSGAANARLWTFTPSTTLDSATLEYMDGTNSRQLLGVRADQMQITGNVNGDNMATFQLFGTDRSDTFGGLTGSLSSRTPTFHNGWETRLYIDTFGGTPGSTLIPDALLNWDVQFKGNLGRVYVANMTQAANQITSGELDITASLTLASTSATALTELANWLNGTKRLVRLEFGHQTAIDADVNAVQTITTTGVPTGGTFTLSIWGQTTAGIAFNATNAQVQSALTALSAIGAGNVTCTGGPLPTGVVATFGGSLAGVAVPAMTQNSAGLTGGTTPTAVVTNTTPGKNYRKTTWIDLPGVWTTPDTDQADSGIRAYKFTYQYQFDSTNGFGLRVQAQSDRTTLY